MPQEPSESPVRSLFVRAEAASLPPVRSLLRDAGLPESDLQEEHMEAFFVSRAGDEGILACVGLERFGETALLRSLAVRADARGHGVGDQALQTMEAFAASKGVNRLCILTTTAEPFFETRGFERCDRTALPASVQASSEFKSLCPASAVCMFKEINPTSSTEKHRHG
ncbi:arsenic resistance N-acetyltransferase ArsN2 [Variovorax sp. ZS18.2.2]|uniref:arsenic resistance N-acetyltransferase ArsN2 n=1 Tax=Variovorax sp. ZS18.2.2 TaxID=2971255 RepID=UPI0021515ADD|nr:arsenic resistance N-acetyltransferase ArsN2 [Variovorax sp. ZS18.2.2]MCR6478470.1 arsenic resistance N-acetyltransferase ArsN2 [Variovorax sp. ZS18.2.2]